MATAAESAAFKDGEWEGVEHLDVAYGTDERHRIDFYQSASAVRASPRPALLIFIHGGSWTSGSRKDHVTFARQLVDKCKGAVTVAVIDYRLTEPKEPSTWAEAKGTQQYVNCHPAHLEDVHAALRFLLLPNEGENTHRSKRVKKSNDQEGRALDVAQKYGYDDSRVVIVGHEVGAWLAMATLLDPRRFTSGSMFAPLLCHDPNSRITLTRKIRAWICLSGVYDLVPILDKAPEPYTEPIAQAFPEDRKDRYGSRAAQLEAASVTSWPSLSREHYHDNQEPRVELLYSLTDEIFGQENQVKDVLRYLRLELGRPFQGSSAGAGCSCCGYGSDYGSDEEGPSGHLARRVASRAGRWGSRQDMLLNRTVTSYIVEFVQEECETRQSSEQMEPKPPMPRPAE